MPVVSDGALSRYPVPAPSGSPAEVITLQTPATTAAAPHTVASRRPSLSRARTASTAA